MFVNSVNACGTDPLGVRGLMSAGAGGVGESLSAGNRSTHISRRPCVEISSSQQQLVPNSTTRSPAMDMLYNTINGQAHNNSITCCTTKLPQSQCQSPTSRHVQMLGCGKFLSVDGEFVVQQVVELWARPLEWKQACAIRRSRIVVASQLNRNFDHFRRRRMRRGIVVYDVS